MQAGGDVIFNERENDWSGIYQLKPYPIYDSAKRLTSNMYIPGSYMCLSFHIKKTLKIGKGGMVLTDDEKFVDWFRGFDMKVEDGRHSTKMIILNRWVGTCI